MKVDPSLSGVLIIEPSENTRAFFNTILSKAGNYNVFTAVTVEDALSIIVEVDPKRINVAIVDLFGNAVGASLLIQKFRLDSNTDHIDILVCSDEVGREDQILLNEFDIRYVTRKSISTNELISKIEEILRDQKTMVPIRRTMKELSHAVLSNDIDSIEKLLDDAQIEKILGEDPDYFHLNGEIHILKREFEKAIQMLSEFLRERGESGQTNTFRSLATLGKALCLAGRFDEALIIFERLSMQSPKNLSHKTLAGDSLLGQGKVDEARDKYKEVLDLDPSNSEAMVGMGKAALAEGGTDEALSIFKSIRGDIDSYSLASYFNNAAVSLTKSGRHEAAIDLYSQAIPLFKKYRWVIVFNMAMTHIRRGDFDTACEMFEDVIEAQPDLAEKKIILREFKDNGADFIKKRYAGVVKKSSA